MLVHNIMLQVFTIAGIQPSRVWRTAQMGSCHKLQGTWVKLPGVFLHEGGGQVAGVQDRHRGKGGLVSFQYYKYHRFWGLGGLPQSASLLAWA